MKHTRPITKAPQSATTNFTVFKEFLINLTEQLIQFIFNATR